MIDFVTAVIEEFLIFAKFPPCPELHATCCQLLLVTYITCIFKYFSCYLLNERNLRIVVECSISLSIRLMLALYFMLILIFKLQFLCCLCQDGLTPLDLCLYSGQSFQTYVLIKLLKQPQGCLWQMVLSLVPRHLEM